MTRLCGGLTALGSRLRAVFCLFLFPLSLKGKKKLTLHARDFSVDSSLT